MNAGRQDAGRPCLHVRCTFSQDCMQRRAVEATCMVESALSVRDCDLAGLQVLLGLAEVRHLHSIALWNNFISRCNAAQRQCWRCKNTLARRLMNHGREAVAKQSPTSHNHQKRRQRCCSGCIAAEHVRQMAHAQRRSRRCRHCRRRKRRLHRSVDTEYSADPAGAAQTVDAPQAQGFQSVSRCRCRPRLSAAWTRSLRNQPCVSDMYITMEPHVTESCVLLQTCPYAMRGWLAQYVAPCSMKPGVHCRTRWRLRVPALTQATCMSEDT